MSSNIPTQVAKSKSERLQAAIMALKMTTRNQKEQIPAGKYGVYSASYEFGKYLVSYVTELEYYHADFSNRKWSIITVDELTLFVEQVGGLEFSVDEQGEPRVIAFHPKDARRYVLGHKEEVIQRYLNAGKAMAYEK